MARSRALFFLQRLSALRSAGHDRLWVHHHIWKCGGSNLCDKAIASKEKVPNPTGDNVCDRCNLMDLSATSLRRRGQGMLSYAELQQPMSDEFPRKLPDMDVGYSVMLRDPINQTLSHYHHALFNRFEEDLLSLREWVDLGLCRRRCGRDADSACLQSYLQSLEARGVDAGSRNLALERVRGAAYFFYFEDNIQVRWIANVVAGTCFGPEAVGDEVGVTVESFSRAAA